MVILLNTEAYPEETVGAKLWHQGKEMIPLIWLFGNPGPAVLIPPMHTGGRHLGVVALDTVLDLKL